MQFMRMSSFGALKWEQLFLAEHRFRDNLPAEARLPTGSVLKPVLHNVVFHPGGLKAIQNFSGVN